MYLLVQLLEWSNDSHIKDWGGRWPPWQDTSRSGHNWPWWRTVSCQQWQLCLAVCCCKVIKFLIWIVLSNTLLCTYHFIEYLIKFDSQCGCWKWGGCWVGTVIWFSWFSPQDEFALIRMFLQCVFPISIIPDNKAGEELSPGEFGIGQHTAGNANILEDEAEQRR